MTRPEEIAAALSAWEIETAQGYDLPSMPSVIAVGDALARLLRAANPPINSESSPGYMEMIGKVADSLPTDDDVELSSAYPGAPLVARPITKRGPVTEPATPAVCPVCKGSRVAHEWRFDDPLPCLNCYTPAVGEDDEMLTMLDGLVHDPERFDVPATRSIAEKALSRLRALLADVARLKEERDQVSQLALHALALDAVRKIADNYHDVDVVGDPPREVACNPCAAEILNVLEGR